MSPDDDALIPTGVLVSTEADTPDSLATTISPALQAGANANGGGDEASRYCDLRAHARGGLGEVYLARDTQFGRQVALKEIQARWRDQDHIQQRFLREAQLTGTLEHPGIVPVYSLGRIAADRPFYAMRFIQGQSLAEAISRLHKANLDRTAFGLELRKLLRRLFDVCNTLHYAHEHGVVHRDIKPQNIMLGSFGETLVVDWGLACRPGEAPTAGGAVATAEEGASGPTLAGDVVGTPAYMSPEQAAGAQDQVGRAWDIYSLGATLYHLLTGRPPLVNVPLAKVQQALAAGDFPRPRTLNPRVSPALEAICLKALAPQPAERYATAAEFGEELEKWLADEPVAAHRESLIERSSRLARRHRAWVSAGMLALALVAAVSVVAAVLVEQSRAKAVQLADSERRQRAQSLYEAAELSLQRGHWKRSCELFREALAADCADPVAAKIRLAEASSSLSRFDDVAALLQELRAMDVGPHRDDLLIAEADFNLTTIEDREAGLARLREALASPTLSPARREYVQGMLAETYPAAIERFRAALAHDPYLYSARVMLITFLLMSGQLDEARRQLELHAYFAPEDYNVHAGYAMLAAMSGDRATALAEVEQLRGRVDEVDMELFRTSIEMMHAVFGSLGEYKSEDRLSKMWSNVAANWPRMAMLLLRHKPQTRQMLYRAPNHPAFIRYYRLGLRSMVQNWLPGDTHALMDELAVVNPDGGMLFARQAARYRALDVKGIVSRGEGRDPQFVATLHEIADGLRDASRRPSLFSFARRESLLLLIDVEASLACSQPGYPGETQRQEAVAAGIRTFLAENPRPTHYELSAMTAAASLIDRPLLSGSLVESYAGGLTGDERLDLDEWQIGFAAQSLDPWHLLKAADRVLAVKPEHSQARQARTLAVESLKSEVERLKP